MSNQNCCKGFRFTEKVEKHRCRLQQRQAAADLRPNKLTVASPPMPVSIGVVAVGQGGQLSPYLNFKPDGKCSSSRKIVLQKASTATTGR